MIHLIIELIIYLVRSSRGPGAVAAPVVERVVDGDKVVIDCPICQTTRLATEKAIERSLARGLEKGWAPVARFVECDRCAGRFNPLACANEGAGVLVVRRWTCASCGTVNDPRSSRCGVCGVA